MDDPMVSVIIPVYKTEQFLDECLNSVIGQNHPALEIILVDDGSPDSCPEICDRYAETYDRVKVIHKKNEGPGPARNTGLEAASGKYIAFVDSDDCLDGAGAIGRLVEQAEKKQADIAVGSFRRRNSQRLSGVNHHRFEEDADTETADFRFKGLILSDHLISVWGKLYRRSFLADNDLKFRDYPFREDHSFNMTCCTCHPLYTFLDESVYLRRSNGDSLSHQYWDNYVSVYTSIASDFEQFLSERGVTEEYSDLIAYFLCFGLFLLTKHELMHKGMAKTVQALSSYGKHPLVRKTSKALARGKYLAQIERKTWKLLLWGASLLCSLHAYVLLAAGIWTLRKIGADKRLAGPQEVVK